jgi:hypothetical protein
VRAEFHIRYTYEACEHMTMDVIHIQLPGFAELWFLYKPKGCRGCPNTNTVIPNVSSNNQVGTRIGSPESSMPNSPHITSSSDGLHSKASAKEEGEARCTQAAFGFGLP